MVEDTLEFPGELQTVKKKKQELTPVERVYIFHKTEK